MLWKEEIHIQLLPLKKYFIKAKECLKALSSQFLLYWKQKIILFRIENDTSIEWFISLQEK